jgi:hypothetical protein
MLHAGTVTRWCLNQDSLEANEDGEKEQLKKERKARNQRRYYQKYFDSNSNFQNDSLGTSLSHKAEQQKKAWERAHQ